MLLTPRCRLLVECNKLAVDIDNEIVIVHNFIRDKYRLKFPELESLVGSSCGGMQQHCMTMFFMHDDIAFCASKQQQIAPLCNQHCTAL